MESFFLSLFLNLLIAALQPKPKLPDARRYALNEFEIPTATEDRAQQYGAGVFRAAGNVVWFGDYKAEAVTEDVDTGLFSSQTVTKGYRYHVGLWLTLAGAPCDELQEIRLGDQVVWSGNLALSKTGTTTLDIDKTWTTSEGQDIPDGMQGRFVFFNHAVAEGADYTPLANPYMESQLGAGNVPGYPNTLHAVWLGPSSASNLGFIGTGPNVPALTFVVKRMPAVSQAFPTGRSITYPVVGSTDNANVKAALDAFIAANSDVAGDANPALAELEVLTSSVPGLGPRLSPWTMDVESYLRKAERLKNEGHGISFAWEASRPVAELVGEIATQTNGFLELNERTGQLRTKLVREDDAVVVAFDDSNIIEIASFTRTMVDQAPNRIEVPFTDRANDWAERLAYAKNAAGVKAAGAVINSRAEFIGVSRSELAVLLATREMRKLSSPLAKASWTGVVPTGTVLKPGDLVIFTHSRLNQTLRMRVVSSRFGGFQNRLRVEIEAVEDVFRGGYTVGTAVSTTPISGGQAAVLPPTSLTNGQALLAPYALTGDDADRLLYLADDSDAATNTYRLAMQQVWGWSSTSPIRYADDEQEPAIVGTLTTTIASSSTGPSMALTLSTTAAEQWARKSRGRVYVIAGNEWLSCDSWQLVGNTLTAFSVVRGIFDTVPQRQVAGSTVRLLLGFTLYPKRLKTYPGASLPVLDGLDTLTVRAESRGSGGILDVAYTATSEARWQYSSSVCRAPKPLPPGNVAIGGVLGVLSDVEAAPLVGRAASASFTWSNRNRLSRSTAGYYQSGSDAEANTRIAYKLQYESTAGVWSDNGWRSAATGASSGTIDTSTSNIPSGARRIRVVVQTERLVGSDVVASSQATVYFRVS